MFNEALFNEVLDTIELTGSTLEEPDMPELYDKTGNRIHIGTILSYPRRRGSDMWHNFGIVTKIIVNHSGQTSVQLFGVGDVYIASLGNVLRTRHVTIQKWHEAIVIRAENVNIKNVTDPSLLFCVKEWHKTQANKILVTVG